MSLKIRIVRGIPVSIVYMGFHPSFWSLLPSSLEFKGLLAGTGYSEEETGRTRQERPAFFMIILAISAEYWIDFDT